MHALLIDCDLVVHAVEVLERFVHERGLPLLHLTLLAFKYLTNGLLLYFLIWHLGSVDGGHSGFF